MAVDDLTLDRLPTPDAVLTLGALVVRALQDKGIVTLFVNGDGVVELCLPGELELDALPEDAVLQVLLDKGYSDKQLLAYLKGRKVRHGRFYQSEGASDVKNL